MVNLTITGIGQDIVFDEESGVIYESATLNDNLEHSGGLTICWNDAGGGALPVGASVVYNGLKYSLLDPYSPTKAGPCHWRYEPCFKHPVARLSRVPFFMKSTETVNGVTRAIQLNTSYFTGYPSTIMSYFTKVFSDIGAEDSEFASTFGSCTAGIYDSSGSPMSSIDDIGYITVNFDNCSISEAASKVADALGCNVFFDMTANGSVAIRFIVGNTIQGESYNCFHVLGGTTNMGKKTVAGTYAPVIQRLTLNPENNPNSMMGGVDEGGIRLTKELIFDNIYPKQELEISNVVRRLCWMKDEEGKKILTTSDDWQKYQDSDGNYKKAFAIYYVQLRQPGGQSYTFNGQTLIEDKPLSILFQPNYDEHANPSPLAGRQFEVAFHESANTFTADPDRNNDIGTTNTPANCFEIINTADEGVIIPNFGGMTPQVGNKVTLVNVALPEEFRSAAQTRLAAAASKIINMMTADSGDYSGTVLGGAPAVGSTATVDNHTGIVTSVNENIDTDEAQVTVGSWHYKTNLGGMRDRIESITMRGGTPTTTENAPTGTSATSVDLILKTRTNYLGKKLMDFGADLEAVKNQTDKEFLIHFGTGDPTDPDTDDPSDDWDTDELKAQHEEDIYYDINRTGSSTGGYAWRWTKYDEGSTLPDGTEAEEDTWMWVKINDTETIAALEKITDVASDEILCGGMEKTTIQTEFKLALNDYQTYYKGLCANMYYDIQASTEAAAVSNTWAALWQILNGGADDPSVQNKYESIPALITDAALATNTKLSDYNITAAQYRTAWNNFYAALGALIKKIEEINKDDTDTAQQAAAEALSKITDMSSDSKIDPVEKQTVKREFLSLWNEKDKTGGIIDSCNVPGEQGTVVWRINYNNFVAPYISAFKAIGSFLNDGTSWTAADSVQTDAYRATDSNLPLWIQSANMSQTQNNISGSTWNTLWSNFYVARTAILTELANVAGTKADAAYNAAQSSVSCHVGDNLPTSYKQGDLWYRTQSGDISNFTLYYCIHTLGENESPAWSHWLSKDLYESGRVDGLVLNELYASLGMLLCNHFLDTRRDAMWIWYGGEHYYEGNAGDFWYVPASSEDSEALYVSNANGGGHWTEYGITYNEYDDIVIDESREQLIYLLQCIHEADPYFGTRRLVLPTRNDIRKSDIVIDQATFRDAFTGKVINGEIGISVCTQSSQNEQPKFEHLRDNTSGILENYGDHIVAAIYGTSEANVKQMKAAGLTITKNFAELFAQAATTDGEGNNELQARAGIKVHVEQTGEDSQGNPTYQGFVDIEGTFRSADSFLRVERYYDSHDYTFTSALMIGEEPQGEEGSQTFIDSMDKQSVVLTERRSQNYATGRLILRHYDRNNDEILSYFSVAGGQCYARNYGVEYQGQEIDGVWDGTFETADGKTVTVIGGIITDISSS